MNSESYRLWAVVDQPTQQRPAPASMIGVSPARVFPGRRLVLVETFSDWATAVEAHRIADERRRAGMGSIPGVFELQYFAVRSSRDLDWERRYPQARGYRLSALTARVGSTVTIRIYNGHYTGHVIRAGLKTATVRFNIPHGRFEQGPREREFPIRPESEFARGVQGVRAF